MKTDNELITEFMGWETSTGNSLANTPLLVYHNPEIVDRVFSASELRFHSSWDWLMPVVKKISRLYDQEPEHLDEYEAVIRIPIIETMENIYKAVVEFIKWYNTKLK